jgi:hydroxypyruvate isomerase
MSKSCSISTTPRRFIAKTLRDIGYEGIVGMEAYPLADSHQAMERFRAVFSNA